MIDRIYVVQNNINIVVINNVVKHVLLWGDIILQLLFNIITTHNTKISKDSISYLIGR